MVTFVGGNARHILRVNASVWCDATSAKFMTALVFTQLNIAHIIHRMIPLCNVGAHACKPSIQTLDTCIRH